MKINVKSPEDMEEYQTKYFSEKGYETLTNNLKSLILLYIKQQEYPFHMPPPLGIPLFEYALDIKTEKEFMGRIKLLGQILGIEKISFDTPDARIVHFNMNGETVICRDD